MFDHSSKNKNSYIVQNPSILVLPGDGIGPEVMSETLRVVDWFANKLNIQFDISHDLIGGCAYEAHGKPVSEATVEKAKQVDVVLFGAVGGPQFDQLDFHLKPEQGLLRLRKELDLFANLRPAKCFDALANFSSLKNEIVQGLDILIIRELTSGLYFGEPRGIIDDPKEGRIGINTQRYTTEEIRRVARTAFDLARLRKKYVCSMEKANVMESGVLWREEVTYIHETEYPDVKLSHMYADNGAMQLVREPKQFDVIVTDNMFGDILSDSAAMLTGSLGMLPSASIGDMSKQKRNALYEPVHGSAPDIAGQAKANPIATILSFAMALKYSFGLANETKRIEDAIEKVLTSGVRTADLVIDNKESNDIRIVSTSEMGDEILAALDESL